MTHTRKKLLLREDEAKLIEFALEKVAEGFEEVEKEYRTAVASLREAARIQADDTFEDGIAYDYTFHCPICGVNVYLPNERAAV